MVCSNNDNTHTLKYGRLYNWYAVNDKRNLAPEGWHIPSDAELQALVNFLGGKDISGGKIKEEGTIHWKSPNTGATNETGFTALPSGSRSAGGVFDGIDLYEDWWTSTQFNELNAWNYILSYDRSDIVKSPDFKGNGLSVRCIKD